MTMLRALLGNGLSRFHRMRHDYGAVQDEAAYASMRRLLISFWIFTPLEGALALWYWTFPVRPDQPQVQVWADALLRLHLITAVITVVLLITVTQLLRRQERSPRLAIALQVLTGLIYLMYGVAVSYLDVAVGGVEAFILISFGVAGLSLMRPSISIPLFSGAMVMLWLMLRVGEPEGQHRAIMLLNAFIAVSTAVVLSWIIFHQYARGLLLRRELEVMASQDPLTLLPNRREVLGRLDRALSRLKQSRRQGALLFIDLDHFKTINDTRGHSVGDVLLIEVAARLRASVRDTDTVARLGGDEFLVLLEDLGPNIEQALHEADRVGQKILELLAQPYRLDGADHRNTTSIGVALFSAEGPTVDELMRQADLAMYQAKDVGRNAMRFFDRGMQDRLIERAALEKDLRQALARSEFVLHYQPQIHLSGQWVGAEALVRWNHPTRGLVPPGQFIPLAEEVGLIVALGNWVLEQACAQLVLWAQSPRRAHLSVSVNVRAHQFRQPNFVATVQAALGASGAHPRHLKLELTESLLVRDVDDVIEKMRQLRAMGVRLSLDDFGTGYSSLAYLKRLPLDELKIDGSFVRDVLVDPSDAAIASVIIDLADTLGMAVMAEGVETAAQCDFLSRAGCVHFQGFHFGRPVPIAEFPA